MLSRGRAATPSAVPHSRVGKRALTADWRAVRVDDDEVVHISEGVETAVRLELHTGSEAAVQGDQERYGFVPGK